MRRRLLMAKASGFVVAVATAVPDARLACVVLLACYYVSGTAFLALSSLQERRRTTGGDGRSLRFIGGLAEGTETIAAYVLMCLFPSYIAAIAWVFAAAVAVTAAQRISFGMRLLTHPSPDADAPSPQQMRSR